MKLPTAPVRTLRTSVIWWSGVVLSLLAYFLVGLAIDRKAHSQFTYHIKIADATLKEQLAFYNQILRTTQALLHSRQNITRDEFRHYAKHLNYAFYVLNDDKDAFEDEIRSQIRQESEEHPTFSIRPDGDREHYHVLTYFEPEDDGVHALGLDILCGKAMKTCQTGTSTSVHAPDKIDRHT